MSIAKVVPEVKGHTEGMRCTVAFAFEATPGLTESCRSKVMMSTHVTRRKCES